jgi:hypothetical protein
LSTLVAAETRDSSILQCPSNVKTPSRYSTADRPLSGAVFVISGFAPIALGRLVG